MLRHKVLFAVENSWDKSWQGIQLPTLLIYHRLFFSDSESYIIFCDEIGVAFALSQIDWFLYISCVCLCVDSYVWRVYMIVLMSLLSELVRNRTEMLRVQKGIEYRIVFFWWHILIIPGAVAVSSMSVYYMKY